MHVTITNTPTIYSSQTVGLRTDSATLPAAPPLRALDSEEEFLSPSLGQVPHFSLGIPKACVVIFQEAALSQLRDHLYTTPIAVIVIHVLPGGQAQPVAVELS